MRIALIRGALVCAGLALLATPSMAFWRHRPLVIVNVGGGGQPGSYGAAPCTYGAAPCGSYGAAPCNYGASPNCSGSYGAGSGCSGSYGAGSGCNGSYGAGSGCYGTMPKAVDNDKDKDRELKAHARSLEKRLDNIIVSLQAEKPSAGSGGTSVASSRPADAAHPSDLAAMTQEWQNRRSAAVAAERDRPAESSPDREPRPNRPIIPSSGVAGR